VGFVVPAGDAEAMATRVRHLLSDHEARLRMGQAARRWVTEEFSTAALAARTAAVYERLLRHRGILPASSDDPVVPDPASRVS
jgi:glycosyltransferase involved in cell wall biosynthesis